MSEEGRWISGTKFDISISRVTYRMHIYRDQVTRWIATRDCRAMRT